MQFFNRILIVSITLISLCTWADCKSEYVKEINNIVEPSQVSETMGTGIASGSLVAVVGLSTPAAPFTIASGGLIIAGSGGLSIYASSENEKYRLDMTAGYNVLLEAELGDGLTLRQMASDLKTSDIQGLAAEIVAMEQNYILCSPTPHAYSDMFELIRQSSDKY